MACEICARLNAQLNCAIAECGMLEAVVNRLTGSRSMSDRTRCAAARNALEDVKEYQEFLERAVSMRHLCSDPIRTGDASIKAEKADLCSDVTGSLHAR